MQHHPINSLYNLRSKPIHRIILLTCYLSIFPAIGIAVQFLEIPKDELQMPKMVFSALFSAPLLLLISVWWDYYCIRITDRNVWIRGLFRGYIFGLDEISGYGINTFEIRGEQREYLHLALKEGQFITIHLDEYHNSDDIKGAFSRGVNRDEALIITRGAKHLKWGEFVTYSLFNLMFVAFLSLSVYNSLDHQENPLIYNLIIATIVLLGVAFSARKYSEYTEMPPK